MKHPAVAIATTPGTHLRVCVLPLLLISPSAFSLQPSRRAQDVHATLCALVMAEAAKHEGWAAYAAVLLFSC